MEENAVVQFLKINIKKSLMVISQFAFCGLVSVINSCEQREAISTYYPNGVLKSRGWLIEGTKDGEFVDYYESGNIKGEIPYKSGKINGIVRTYYVSGKLHCIKQFENDSINGQFLELDEKGDTILIGNYKSNKMHGLIVRRYNYQRLNIDIVDCTYYKNGLMDGLSRTYLKDNNKLLIDSKYKDGDYLEGFHYNYESNGHEFIEYRKNIDGIYRTYDYPEMRLTRIEKFTDDSVSYIYVSSTHVKNKNIVEKVGKIDFLTKKDTLELNRFYGKGCW